MGEHDCPIHESATLALIENAAVIYGVMAFWTQSRRHVCRRLLAHPPAFISMRNLYSEFSAQSAR